VIYSCFNAHGGGYDYFDDGAGFPVNGDLPVPTLPAPAGTIGVPSIHAGRPLPANAKPAGKGLYARGILVECGLPGALSGDASGDTWPPAWKWAVAIGLAGAVIWAAQTKPVRSLVGG